MLIFWNVVGDAFDENYITVDDYISTVNQCAIVSNDIAINHPKYIQTCSNESLHATQVSALR